MLNICIYIFFFSFFFIINVYIYIYTFIHTYINTIHNTINWLSVRSSHLIVLARRSPRLRWRYLAGLPQTTFATDAGKHQALQFCLSLSELALSRSARTPVQRPLTSLLRQARTSGLTTSECTVLIFGFPPFQQQHLLC